MKRFLIISYWVVSILLVAVVLTSIDYRFLEALFIGSMKTCPYRCGIGLTSRKS